MQYISEETDQPTTIVCRYADRPEMECGEDKTAVALRGQWEGGDVDVDPRWIPVCADHDARWDVDFDTGEARPERYRLPRFPLDAPRPRRPRGDGMAEFVVDLRVVVEVDDALVPEEFRQSVPKRLWDWPRDLLDAIDAETRVVLDERPVPEASSITFEETGDQSVNA
jgi:hypothetical protein